MTHELDAEEELKRKVRDFRDRYLMFALERAQRDEIDTRYAAFALLECVQIIVDHCYQDREEALRVGEMLVEGFMKDWRSTVGLLTSGD